MNIIDNLVSLINKGNIGDITLFLNTNKEFLEKENPLISMAFIRSSPYLDFEWDQLYYFYKTNIVKERINQFDNWDKVIIPLLYEKLLDNKHKPFLDRYCWYYASEMDQKSFIVFYNTPFFTMLSAPQVKKMFIHLLTTNIRNCQDISWFYNSKETNFLTFNQKREYLTKSLLENRSYESISKVLHDPDFLMYHNKELLNGIIYNSCIYWDVKEIDTIIKLGGKIVDKSHNALIMLISYSEHDLIEKEITEKLLYWFMSEALIVNDKLLKEFEKKGGNYRPNYKEILVNTWEKYMVYKNLENNLPNKIEKIKTKKI